jgi:hypothetical protein
VSRRLQPKAQAKTGIKTVKGSDNPAKDTGLSIRFGRFEPGGCQVMREPEKTADDPGSNEPFCAGKRTKAFHGKYAIAKGF